MAITQEAASLVHFINGLKLKIKKSYFGEIPEGFTVPCIYYPTPEVIRRGFSTSGYEKESIIYIKVFDKTSMDSDCIAQQIVEGIMQAKRNIPIYGEDGNETDTAFHVYTVNTRNLETGVTQVEISYKTYTSYIEPEAETAQNIFIDIDGL